MSGRSGSWRGRVARRGVAVALCAGGAAVVLLAAGRPWVVEVTARPDPLPDLRTTATGGDRWPWLGAAGWVALAGAGALLATRAGFRRAVGALLALAGAVVAVAGAVAATSAETTTPGWPALATLGGLAVAGAGVLAVARSHRWPALAARYERPEPTSRATGTGVPRARSSGSDQGSPGSPEHWWDALDRGEDPTAR